MAKYRISVEETASWQKPVLSILDTPPVTPSKGDRYIVGDDPTGAWSGKANSIAWYDGTSWKFDTPSIGWQTYNIDLEDNMVFEGDEWVEKEFPVVSGKMDKDASATTDELVNFDATGNAHKSGVMTPTFDAELGNIIMEFL